MGFQIPSIWPKYLATGTWPVRITDSFLYHKTILREFPDEGGSTRGREGDR